MTWNEWQKWWSRHDRNHSLLEREWEQGWGGESSLSSTPPRAIKYFSVLATDKTNYQKENTEPTKNEIIPQVLPTTTTIQIRIRTFTLQHGICPQSFNQNGHGAPKNRQCFCGKEQCSRLSKEFRQLFDRRGGSRSMPVFDEAEVGVDANVLSNADMNANCWTDTEQSL